MFETFYLMVVSWCCQPLSLFSTADSRACSRPLPCDVVRTTCCRTGELRDVTTGCLRWRRMEKNSVHCDMRSHAEGMRLFTLANANYFCRPHKMLDTDTGIVLFCIWKLILLWIIELRHCHTCDIITNSIIYFFNYP